MRPFRRIAILAFIFMGSASHAVAAPLAADGWLAFGELRGYYEPCGCDPDADLGGVERQIALLERERALQPRLHVFSLGNNLPTHPSESYKTPSLLAALKRMNLSAYLVNELEYNALLEKQTKFSALPLVLSNARAALPGVKPVVSDRGVAVFGFLYRSSFKQSLKAADNALLASWKKIAPKDAERILLFSGDDVQLSFFKRSSWFSEIISANDTPLDRIVGPDEKIDEGKLLRRPSGVRMVPVGGQGILRGGILTQKKAPLLKDLLLGECSGSSPDPAKCTPQNPSGLLRTEELLVSWLDKSYRGLSSTLDDVSKTYVKAGQDRFSDLVGERKKQLTDTRYAGSEACKSCHADAYEIWRKSGHAHAFATLQKQNRAKDPQCVSCHVVGFHEKGGFVSQEDSPQFANVQCENCHGPRKEHTTDSSLKPQGIPLAKEVCTSCHQGTHSSNFDYKLYWEKIKHSVK